MKTCQKAGFEKNTAGCDLKTKGQPAVYHAPYGIRVISMGIKFVSAIPAAPP